MGSRTCKGFMGRSVPANLYLHCSWFSFFKQQKKIKNLLFSSHFGQTFFKHVYIHVFCKFEHRIQEQAVRVEQECVVAAVGTCWQTAHRTMFLPKVMVAPAYQYLAEVRSFRRSQVV